MPMFVFVENTDNKDSNSENDFDIPIEATLLSKKKNIDWECALKKEIGDLKMKCAIP